MDSDLHNHHGSHHHHHQQQQQQDMINNNMYRDKDITPLFNHPVSRFSGGDSLSSHHNLNQIPQNESHFINSKKMYHNFTQSQETVHNNNSIVASSRLESSSTTRAPATNLLRQSSSPAGFFEHVNIDNGYSIMGSMDKFGHVNGSVPDSSFSPRMKNAMDFSSGSYSSSNLMSRVLVGYELGESDQINSCDNKNEGEIHGPTGLTHQLSLPTSSTELSAMENMLQFQDNVPLRSRAKRGCATHPRSIAERVRRTRISERMKKLQDLVPNMDKQTSIADMLDLAVDYIKNLQKHVETLADHHAKCRCSNKKNL